MADNKRINSIEVLCMIMYLSDSFLVIVGLLLSLSLNDDDGRITKK